MKSGRKEKGDKEILALCDQVRQIAFELHRYLRQGHLEKVENGLVNRLRESGVNVEQQKSLDVRDENGAVLGEYFADLMVEGCLIVELKVCKALAPEHTAQALGYLRATGCRHALLINFGAPRMQFRKLVL